MRGLREVVDVSVDPSMEVSELVELYGRMHGFTPGSLYEAVEILSDGIRGSSLRILAFTGNLIASGLRGVISQLVRMGYFNVVITTTGAIDHDVARSMGGRYYAGSFDADDEELSRRGVYRLGNIYIPEASYGGLIEGFVRGLVREASRRREGAWGLYELLELAGELIGDDNSILKASRESGAQVFVPGWPDGAFGTSLFMASSSSSIRVDYYRDLSRIAEVFFHSEGASTALIVGGGISKHHAIWWAQFRGGLDYVVYLTTAVEYDGSLSGARPREAVTWGKVKAGARRAVVYGDATLTLPLIAAGVMARVSGARR